MKSHRKITDSNPLMIIIIWHCYTLFSNSAIDSCFLTVQLNLVSTSACESRFEQCKWNFVSNRATESCFEKGNWILFRKGQLKQWKRSFRSFKLNYISIPICSILLLIVWKRKKLFQRRRRRGPLLTGPAVERRKAA